MAIKLNPDQYRKLVDEVGPAERFVNATQPHRLVLFLHTGKWIEFELNIEAQECKSPTA
jgi:hypothetical protein